MSYRYRTIYREPAKCDPTGEKISLWGAVFSPCQQQARPSTSHNPPSTSGYCHLLIASSVGSVLCYHLQDKNDSADISTLTETNVLNAHGEESILGCAAVSVVENNDVGESVVASITLNGDVRLYHHRILPSSSKESSPMHFIADTYFTVANATGNNVSICPCQHESQVIVAVGCIDGSTKMFHTGLTLGSNNRKGTTIQKVLPSGTLLETMGQGNACVMSIAWSPKGDLLAVGRKDGIVDVFSSPFLVGTLNREGTTTTSIHGRVHRMVAHSSFVRALSFSPDGALLLTGGDDGRVHAYDIMRRKVALVGSFVGHKSWILGIAWHPDASRFATCSADKTVKIWEASTKQNVHTFEGHMDKVWGISFSPCGTRLASCGDDGIIQIYSCEKQ